MNRNQRNFAVLTFAWFSLLVGREANQQETVRFASAVVVDSLPFAANQPEGWSAISSYATKLGEDSVRLEVLIQHANNISWADEHLIGAISDSLYRPTVSQLVDYTLLSNSKWKLRITPDGGAYLQLAQGVAPPEDPAIFPVAIQYRIH
jgi:hypothetical protein